MPMRSLVLPPFSLRRAGRVTWARLCSAPYFCITLGLCHELRVGGLSACSHALTGSRTWHRWPKNVLDGHLAPRHEKPLCRKAEGGAELVSCRPRALRGMQLMPARGRRTGFCWQHACPGGHVERDGLSVDACELKSTSFV